MEVTSLKSFDGYPAGIMATANTHMTSHVIVY